MRKSTYLPAAALALGAVGFGLRRWAVSAAFEPDTGLAVSGHPAFWLLGALTILAAVGLALLCRGGRQLAEEECPLALSSVSSLHMTLAAAAAILTLLAGGASFLDLLSVFHAVTYYDSGVLSCVNPLLLGSFAVVSGICLLVLARQRYQLGREVSFSFLPLIPAFFTCFWLIDVYRVRASDPVILEYAWFFLADIALVLALYCSAGFAFRNGKPFMALYWSLLAVVFALTTAADPHSLTEYLLLAAGVLWCLAQAHALLRNLELDQLSPPPERPRSDRPDEDDGDDVDIVL